MKQLKDLIPPKPTPSAAAIVRAERQETFTQYLTRLHAEQN